MRLLLLLLKIISAPLWIPYWLFFKACKYWKVFFVLVIGSIISCANNSSKLNRSPCAGCDFQPINPPYSVGKNHHA